MAPLKVRDDMEVDHCYLLPSINSNIVEIMLMLQSQAQNAWKKWMLGKYLDV